MYKLELTDIFFEIDDFCKHFESEWKKNLITSGQKNRNRKSRLSMSEILTILMGFHVSSFRDFKHYYLHLSTFQKNDFPKLVSYTQFLSLAKSAIIPLTCFIEYSKPKCDGVQFVDCTPIPICHPKRISSNKVFKGIARTGRSSMGWFHGFKLGAVVNSAGEMLRFCLVPGNTDDRKCLSKMARGLFGKIFADKGFLSQKLFEKLLKQGLKLVTHLKKNMKPKLMEFTERIFLRKRSLIESVYHTLKDVLHIDHTRHRSPFNFVANLVSGLAAYSLYPHKPKLRNVHSTKSLAFP